MPRRPRHLSNRVLLLVDAWPARAEVLSSYNIYFTIIGTYCNSPLITRLITRYQSRNYSGFYNPFYLLVVYIFAAHCFPIICVNE